MGRVSLTYDSHLPWILDCVNFLVCEACIVDRAKHPSLEMNALEVWQLPQVEKLMTRQDMHMGTGSDFFVGNECIERPLSFSLRYRTRAALHLAGSLTPHGTFETRHFALATIPNEAVCSYSNGH